LSRESSDPGSGGGRGGLIRRGVLQVALGLTALVVFFWRIDAGAVLDQFTLIDPRWALLGLLVFTSSKVLHAWRWWAFLGRREVPLLPLAGIFLLSNMANSLLPLRAGDLLRVEVPNRRYGVPRSTLVSSVFVVESVLDLFAFAILLVTALLLSDLPVAMRPLVGLVGGSAVALMGLLVVMSRSQEAVVPVAARFLGWLPDRVWARIEGALPPFVDGMSSLKTNREAARVVVVSLVAWLAEVVVYWILARAFGLDLSVQQALILMIAANLVVSLPLTPWSVGPYELIVTETLVVLGADRNESAAFALGSHLMLQAWIAVTGVLAMWALQLRPRDLLPGRHPEADPEAVPEVPSETTSAPPDQIVG
jgi:uncharacterized protein (TIRG00374 family)